MENHDKKRMRLAISLFFFCQGICFATWASRIPDIKDSLSLSDATLGSLLFALPFGQLCTLPFSGRVTSYFSSQKVLVSAIFFYSLAMSTLGLAQNTWQLALSLFFFGVGGNFCNIAVNTQGVAAEVIYKKSIMTSFHGAWSAAGFTGAFVAIILSNLKVSPLIHFIMIQAIVVLIVFFNKKYLIQEDPIRGGNKKKFKFRMPDKILILLGIMGFFSMASEGTMFDWSGVYFKDVVKAPNSLVTLGYAAFMITMASGRFIGDSLIAQFGRKKIMQICGLLISFGLYTAVLFPYLIPSTIAFMIVGLGVSTIVPVVYSLTGKVAKGPPSQALTFVSSISFLGFLLGPPVIGYISEIAGLKMAYAMVGLFGIGIALLASKLKVADPTEN